MSNKKTICVSDFVEILDLKHPKYSKIGVFGEVIKISDQTVDLKISPDLGFGSFLKKDLSKLEWVDKGSVTLAQLQGLGYPLSSVLPLELL